MRAKVIFTFDGDEAGQNAALKSFALDQQFLAQTFVAVDPDGLDPCDLRQQRGDQAVRALLEARVPLFEFVIKTTLAGHDLNTPEGRVTALRAAAPVVARLRDSRATARVRASPCRLAWHGHRHGLGHGDARRIVVPRGRPLAADQSTSRARPRADARHVPTAGIPWCGPRRCRLGALLQAPGAIRSVPSALSVADDLEAEAFAVPQYRAVFSAISAAGGVRAAGRRLGGRRDR